MLRKNKTTEITPRTEDVKLAGRGLFRSPYEWFEEMDRWFDDLRRSFFSRWGLAPLSIWPGERLAIRQPLVDLVDNGREFLVRAELPGVAKEDVDLQVTPDGVEIRAETGKQREEKDTDYYYRERTYSTIHRVLAFPEEVIPDQAEATLKDGLLEVRVPKKEPTPERKAVKVRVE